MKTHFPSFFEFKI